MKWIDLSTGKISPMGCKDWACPNGNKRLTAQWRKRLTELMPTDSGVLTTKYSYTPKGLLLANKRLASMLKWMRVKFPGIKYGVGLDLTKQGKIHFNTVFNYTPPRGKNGISRRAIRQQWFQRTGCYFGRFKKAHNNSVYYLVKRAAASVLDTIVLPAWSASKRAPRRIHASQGLIPARKKESGEIEPRRYAVYFNPNAHGEEVETLSKTHI